MFGASLARRPIPGSTFLVVFPQQVINFDTVGNQLAKGGHKSPTFNWRLKLCRNTLQKASSVHPILKFKSQKVTDNKGLSSFLCMQWLIKG